VAALVEIGQHPPAARRWGARHPRNEIEMATTAERDEVEFKMPRLVRILVKGGYLDGFDVEFPFGGSVIIGEHGVGKSTLLALLAFVLVVTVPAANAEERERLLQKNLGNGRVYVGFETAADGLLTFSRALTRPRGKKDVGHDPPRFEPEMSRPGAPVAWSKDLFPVHFSGHGELAMLATDGAARLELVERFAGPELGKKREELAKVRGEIDG
jgi:hypothetical protein